jgi:hypothetical protein
VALSAIADVAEAEQATQGTYVAPVTPDDRAAHLEAPAPARPKDFGRRKGGPKKPKRR